MQIEAVRLNDEIGLVTDRSEDRQLSTRLHGLGKVVEDSGMLGVRLPQGTPEHGKRCSQLCIHQKALVPVNQSALRSAGSWATADQMLNWVRSPSKLGGLAERSNAPDCKSGIPRGGSNPSSPTTLCLVLCFFPARIFPVAAARRK